MTVPTDRIAWLEERCFTLEELSDIIRMYREEVIVLLYEHATKEWAHANNNLAVANGEVHMRAARVELLRVCLENERKRIEGLTESAATNP